MYRDRYRVKMKKNLWMEAVASAYGATEPRSIWGERLSKMWVPGRMCTRYQLIFSWSENIGWVAAQSIHNKLSSKERRMR